MLCAVSSYAFKSFEGYEMAGNPLPNILTGKAEWYRNKAFNEPYKPITEATSFTTQWAFVTWASKKSPAAWKGPMMNDIATHFGRIFQAIFQYLAAVPTEFIEQFGNWRNGAGKAGAFKIYYQLLQKALGPPCQLSVFGDAVPAINLRGGCASYQSSGLLRQLLVGLEAAVPAISLQGCRARFDKYLKHLKLERLRELEELMFEANKARDQAAKNHAGCDSAALEFLRTQIAMYEVFFQDAAIIQEVLPQLHVFKHVVPDYIMRGAPEFTEALRDYVGRVSTLTTKLDEVGEGVARLENTVRDIRRESAEFQQETMQNFKDQAVLIHQIKLFLETRSTPVPSGSPSSPRMGDNPNQSGGVGNPIAPISATPVEGTQAGDVDMDDVQRSSDDANPNIQQQPPKSSSTVPHLRSKRQTKKKEKPHTCGGQHCTAQGVVHTPG
ncbi:hypothetical protein CYMTET_30038 [Cymbomonas tetramitiformis]|uniref:Uncharacterized protein n=1 Tax=Cymbomonas tetramitiformis TaxID=36881 RepID=A0AAE0FJS4_9CHLO|nr:hypothetical protein CYMTET_30038 [Cymbomonas tetramitiformis]